MPGFSGAQSSRYRGQITHFSQHNDVRVMTQRVYQSGIKGLGIISQVALDDNAFFIGVDKFDGVLNSDNMPPGVFIKIVNHRALCGGLTGAARAGDKN